MFKNYNTIVFETVMFFVEKINLFRSIHRPRCNKIQIYHINSYLCFKSVMVYDI